ncbi:MAG: RNA methyltransferase [Planctomycetes bacterium]|nr:RNA methyltransferase [Planctomycetota bacterium]
MEPVSKAKLKQLRSLTSRKGREEAGLFIAEGPLIIEEGFKAGVFPRYVVVSDSPGKPHDAPRDTVMIKDASTLTDKLIARCKQENIDVCNATPEEFAEGADTVNSQGILAVYGIPKYSLPPLMEKPDITLLVLDNMREPGNLGTIIRQAAAFDCGALLLIKGCVDAYNNKAVRATMGGIFHVPIFDELTPEDVMGKLTQYGVWPYVAARGGASAFSISFPPKTAFVIGGETEGVQPFWNERDVIKVGIPQTDKVESLNAAVAASIFMANRYQAKDK